MCFEKVPCMAFILRKWGFGTALKRCGIHSKPHLNAEKLVFHSFWNPNMRAQAHVCIRMH